MTKQMMKSRFLFLFCLFAVASGFTAHKFYMSIYQVHFNQEKSRIEITGRIFIDDLNDCVSKYAKERTHIGEKGQTGGDIQNMTRYLGDHFRIKVDGNLRLMTFLRCETEENTVICYFRIDDVKKVTTLEVLNKSLMNCHPEQQNIIQAEVSGTKKNLLLTEGENSGKLDFSE